MRRGQVFNGGSGNFCKRRGNSGESAPSNVLFCGLSRGGLSIVQQILRRRPIVLIFVPKYMGGLDVTPVQKATPVGGTVQIKQLIVVLDRVLCTRYFVL